jgi:hypothetical protein
MDLVICQKVHAKSGHLITPLLDVRCVGVEGFWSAVRRLTESDCEGRFRYEENSVFPSETQEQFAKMRHYFSVPFQYFH